MVNSRWVLGSSTGTLEPSINIVKNKANIARTAINVLISPLNVKREFREGKISLDGMHTLISFLVSLETFKTFKLYKRGNFIVAFSKLFFREDYDHNYMTKKYKTYYPNLTKQTSVDEYLSVLCNKIYSYGKM